MKRLTDKFGIEFGPEDPGTDYFLGADRIRHGPHSATLHAHTYITLMAKRYLPDGHESYPKKFAYVPADDTLVKAHATAVAHKVAPAAELTARYRELVGSLMYAVKFRPEIGCAMGLCGQCLTFATEDMYKAALTVLVYLARTSKVGTTFTGKGDGVTQVKAFADSNWDVRRSTSGFTIMLGGASIFAASRRQHCISMSSCEAELIALAECAIELLFVLGVLEALGYKATEPVRVYTDNKAAHDLCNRYTTGQNSRHIDRKMFKMRELRGAGVVSVSHVPTDENPADLMTKILSRQPFERHRATVLNTAGAL